MGPVGGNRELFALLMAASAALIVSGLEPFDRATWLMEVAPVIVGVRRIGISSASVLTTGRKRVTTD